MALNDWVSRIADNVERNTPDGQIVVASGVSPSGPIHMGNLREIMTSHFVADELERRGRNVRFILFWDDYDRFRKVPFGVPGVDETWAQYIGQPLSDVPAPHGSEHPTWAMHFISQFVNSLDALGVHPEYISQAEEYANGTYLDAIVTGLNSRVRIGTELAALQTKGERLDPQSYYPFRAYCTRCGRDTTHGTSWDEVEQTFGYECDCGYAGQGTLFDDVYGKLVWKVDWPMRWAHYGVSFEPCGADHMSPGSSWDAGERIVPVFDGVRPLGQGYSFVGFDGQAKMASSSGGAPTPSDLLPVLGPHLIRWLYARSRPNAAFTVDMLETARLYDSWDALSRKVTGGKGKDGDIAAFTRATTTAENAVPNDDTADVSFGAWTSFADMTNGNADAMMTLANSSLGRESGALPFGRGQRATAWVENYMPVSERTVFRTEPNVEAWNRLDENVRQAIRVLADGLESNGSSLSELTRWTFGVPKLMFGFDVDERNLPDEVRSFQREYFTAVYQLLISSDSGPRLPLLLTCLGFERAKGLLDIER